MRIGYDNSNSNWARQALKLGYGLRGWVPDGVLFRVSTIGVPPELSFKIQDKFIHDLLNAVDPQTREFMVGDPEEGAAVISSRELYPVSAARGLPRSARPRAEIGAIAGPERGSFGLPCIP